MNFEVIFKWCLEHWRDLLSILVAVVCLLISIIRKRPKYALNILDVVKEDLLEVLPGLINVVECPGDGANKLKKVVQMALSYCSWCLNRTLKDDEISYLTKFITESVEKILSTPTKGE